MQTSSNNNPAMTTINNEIPAASYALLASGANFSCEVLQALQQRNYLPRLLLLPEYPPAEGIQPAHEIMQSTSPQRRLLLQAHEIEIGYAPATQQSACAGLIEHHAIDFLLVACWPYLIDNILLDSARKEALNMHPSLLPDFRGPDPLGQQLENGHSSFGVSLHLLNQYFDQGDIIAQAELGDFDCLADRSSLEHYCALLGVELFIAAVTQHEQGWKPVRQSV